MLGLGASTVYATPPQPAPAPREIHLAIVACKSYLLEETTVLLESAAVLTRAPLAVHVFADGPFRTRLGESLQAWPERVRSRVRLDFHDLDAAACAGRRPALATLAETLQDTDRVISVDTDIVFLRPLDGLWRLFDDFKPGQTSATSAGLNLLDLRTIRAGGPEKPLSENLSCAWSFRTDDCLSCKPEEGVGAVHEDNQPTFRAVYEAWLSYPLGEDLAADLLEPLRFRLAAADPADACAPARAPILESLAREAGRWTPPGPPPEGGRFHDVAVAQLAPWRGRGIHQEDLERVRRLAMPTIRYQILGGKLYRAPACSPVRRCPGIDHFLMKAAPLVPDAEFFVNPNDYPVTGIADPLPVFSFSKIPRSHGDILYPVWAFWHDDPWLGVVPHWRWDEMSRELLQAGDAVPWEKKKPVVFFRGGLTSPLREPYTLYSPAHRGQWDVRFTPHPSPKFMARVAELGAEVAEPVPPRDHCAWRYLMNVDGISSSHRLRMMMACGGVVLYVQPTWMEFYYYKLVPWKHFVPLPLDPAAGQKVLDFLETHQDVARKIASNGREFIASELTIEEVDRYWVDLLREYAALQRFTPKKDPAFVEVQEAEEAP
jgi:hypothetical protein